jgi:hypothetical protein
VAIADVGAEADGSGAAVVGAAAVDAPVAVVGTADVVEPSHADGVSSVTGASELLIFARPFAAHPPTTHGAHAITTSPAPRIERAMR